MKIQRRKNNNSKHLFMESSENIPLNNCVFGDSYKGELKEINKHEKRRVITPPSNLNTSALKANF